MIKLMVKKIFTILRSILFCLLICEHKQTNQYKKMIAQN